MFIPMVRRNAALVALLGLLGLAGASTPALAQAPTISTIDCKFYFRDLLANGREVWRLCGPIYVGMKRVLVVSCSGAGNCTASVTDYMRAGRTPFPAEYGILAVNAFSMNPSTCRPRVDWTIGPAWCAVGPATNNDYVQAISVVSHR